MLGKLAWPLPSSALGKHTGSSACTQVCRCGPRSTPHFLFSRSKPATWRTSTCWRWPWWAESAIRHSGRPAVAGRRAAGACRSWRQSSELASRVCHSHLRRCPLLTYHNGSSPLPSPPGEPRSGRWISSAPATFPRKSCFQWPSL